MLVLSRRQDDQILFPNLGISVKILRVAGQKVRLGVEAPPEVKVLRHELRDTAHEQAKQAVSRQPAGDNSAVQQRLQDAAATLNELYQLCDRDLQPDSERLIFELFRHLKSIDAGATDISAAADEKQERAVRRALLVEDNYNESKLLASYLRMRSFDVAIASDGAAAIDYLSHNDNPDVVLLDMQMPGMNGATAIRRMRADERHSDLKVFAVSGSDPADYGVDIGPEGVDGWFPKPLDPEALVFRLAFEDELPGTFSRTRPVAQV